MTKPDHRTIKPYLEKKKVKGITYYQLVKKARIDGKVKLIWSKYLGSAENIQKVYPLQKEWWYRWSTNAFPLIFQYFTVFCMIWKP